ncbi:GAF and ANTAR domain-containing protein [Mumia qirimensis]|uniref:GAF and ANTAR domain-containing protein n=1 Tax=Mumia qirimensis TaxID=3234852 RepID=UPI00351D637D
MKGTHSLSGIAGSSSALVQDYDLMGALAKTVAEATEHVGAEAGGLLVTNTGGDLELLSATSHRVTELETYQAFSGEGPCVECVRQQETVQGELSQVADRWPTVAAIMESSGYTYVLATPLRWRGTALGGLNLFWRRPPDAVAEAETAAQAYSDILTLFIINAGPVGPEVARQRVEVALEGRAVIEQAKGVLSELEGLSMDDAYERLLELERSTGEHLTDVARGVVRKAQERA